MKTKFLFVALSLSIFSVSSFAKIDTQVYYTYSDLINADNIEFIARSAAC
jgi:hypothetical protein